MSASSLQCSAPPLLLLASFGHLRRNINTFRLETSANNELSMSIIANFVWDCQEITFVDYLEKSKIITAPHYSLFLDHHDNARNHISAVVVTKLLQLAFQLV